MEGRRGVSYHAEPIYCNKNALCFQRVFHSRSWRHFKTSSFGNSFSLQLEKRGPARWPWLTHNYRQAREGLGPEPRARATPASGLNKKSKIRIARSGPLLCSHLKEDINLSRNYLSHSSCRGLKIVLCFSCLNNTRWKRGRKSSTDIDATNQ